MGKERVVYDPLPVAGKINEMPDAVIWDGTGSVQIIFIRIGISFRIEFFLSS